LIVGKALAGDTAGEPPEASAVNVAACVVAEDRFVYLAYQVERLDVDVCPPDSPLQ
jgi:hypothetical protein